jgi:SsrA-binding protein
MGNKEDKAGGRRTAISNRKARHEYFIEDTYTAGMVLVGTEVKSLRAGKANLNDAFARFDKAGELWLYNMHVSPHAEGNRYNVDPLRPRKLLLTRRELKKLESKTTEKGYTIVPLRIFFNEKNLAKIEIGIGKGKKLHDKRETIKQRDTDKEIKRYLKR